MAAPPARVGRRPLRRRRRPQPGAVPADRVGNSTAGRSDRLRGGPHRLPTYAAADLGGARCQHPDGLYGVCCSGTIGRSRVSPPSSSRTTSMRFWPPAFLASATFRDEPGEWPWTATSSASRIGTYPVRARRCANRRRCAPGSRHTRPRPLPAPATRSHSCCRTSRYASTVLRAALSASPGADALSITSIRSLDGGLRGTSWVAYSRHLSTTSLTRLWPSACSASPAMISCRERGQHCHLLRR